MYLSCFDMNIITESGLVADVPAQMLCFVVKDASVGNYGVSPAV